MTTRSPTAPVAVMLAMAFMLVAAHAAAEVYGDPVTALHEYVAAEDPAYDYRLVHSATSDDGYTVHLLRMISQRWRAPGEARPGVWRHWLVVVVPDEVSKNTAALVVAGGSRDSDPPSLDDDEVRFGVQLAVISETVVAVLFQVPEQPLFFHDEPFPHEGEALVAYSWDKALETGDYSWPVYLPMVKATVRAMDTVQDLVPSIVPVPIEQFVVIGASKRGAATWLTPVVDARVVAIAPLVIDILNFAAQIEHHLAVYGTYAPAIADYVEYGLVQRIDTVEGQALMRVVDPFAYRDALDLPKYIINSTGDQFFPLDSSKFYYRHLPGENLLRYVPNSDHSLGNTDASLLDTVSGLFGWYLAVVNDVPRPTIAWRRNGDRLVVVTSPRPLAARLWQATNPETRDFRLEATGEAWRPAELAPVAPGRYAVNVPPPTTGWTAYFVELVYPSLRPGLCEVYSTRVFVMPDVRPFDGTDLQTAAALGDAGGDTMSAPARNEDELTAQSLFDEIFQDVADEVQDAVLDEAVDDGDLENRAIRYCFAHEPDDLDEALELYARLGFGQSVDALLDDLVDDVVEEGGEVIDEGGDVINEVGEEIGDFVDDLF